MRFHDIEVLEETKAGAEIDIEPTSSSDASANEVEKPQVKGNLHSFNAKFNGKNQQASRVRCSPVMRRLRPLGVNHTKKRKNAISGSRGLVTELDRVEMNVEYA